MLEAYAMPLVLILARRDAIGTSTGRKVTDEYRIV